MVRIGVFALSLMAFVQATPVCAAALASRVLDAVPQHVVTLDALARARAALAPTTDRGPGLLAIPVPFPLGLDDGAWTADGDTAVWRMRLNSAGATLLIASFDRFELPPGAELLFSDVDGVVTQGPYTAAHRTPDGHFWTAMVPGDAALLELRVPASRRDEVELHLAQLGHGVHPLSDGGAQAKSGSCNVDAACETDPGWREQIRSVVLLQIGNAACTGNLVNTTAQDDRPYILTATHCGITATNAAQVIAYFNFQTSTCGGTPNGSLNQTVTGASLLFQHTRSDHTLIRLRSAPPLRYAAYFAGFDASATAIPQSGRGIHHPSSDEKRISTYVSPAFKTPVSLSGVGSVDAFAVTWSAGVTERGSSGSGLWNENKRMVGVLSGGAAACGTLGLGASSGPDYYGRLHVAWSAGLASWLNPGDSGITTVAGKNQTSLSGGSSSTPGTGATTGSSNAGTGESGGGGGGGSLSGALLLAVALARRAMRGTQEDRPA